MIWGGFCGRRKTTLHFLDDHQTSANYMATLQQHLQPSFDKETQIFQHDNAAPHAARATRQWLSSQNIDVMTWPACSPDLNPIENVWGYMTHQVYAGGRQFYSIKDLQATIQKVWDDLPVTYLEALVRSMSERVQKLKKAKGKHFQY